MTGVQRWDELTHAYGPASDVPSLLASARYSPAPSAYESEPWFSLWSALCHQGDIYPASLAAVPEFVGLAKRRQADAGVLRECLYLAGCIEMERHREDAPAIPVEVQAAYQDALIEGARLAEAALRSADDEDSIEMLSLSLAAFRGDIAEARRVADGAEE